MVDCENYATGKWDIFFPDHLDLETQPGECAFDDENN